MLSYYEMYIIFLTKILWMNKIKDVKTGGAVCSCLSEKRGSRGLLILPPKGKMNVSELCNCIQKYKCDNEMFQMFTNNDLLDANIRPFIENSYSS